MPPRDALGACALKHAASPGFFDRCSGEVFQVAARGGVHHLDGDGLGLEGAVSMIRA